MLLLSSLPRAHAAIEADAEIVLSVRDLVVDYGATRAVDEVGFEVRRGEVFGLLGTNGAGKTTTLDVLEGFRAPTSGTVRVLGADPLVEHDLIAPRLGIMLQDAGFFEDLTVRQTLRAWRRFYAHPRGIDASLEIVGLEHRAGVRVKRLSGGERRRLDLALALLGHPEVLFLDEPTTGMDPEGRRRCLEIVRGLVDEGLTVILTTHYLEEAELLADRVAIMHRGRIRIEGTLDEVLATQRRSTIGFEVAGGADAVLDQLLVGVDAHLQRTDRSTTVTWETTEPQADLTRLLAAAERLRVPLQALAVSRPSLEDLFLDMAGDATTASGDRS